MSTSKEHSTESPANGLAPRFDRLSSRLAPLPIENIDTDQIIPAEYLKTTSREGLAAGLFAGWRGQGTDFVLDDERYRDAKILVAGENFGCGSSREHAPWALLDHGIRAVISTRFADIFRSNALKNGLLPVVVDTETLDALLRSAAEQPEAEAILDLERRTLITPWDETLSFDVDAFARRCLLEGVDALGYLLSRGAAIDAFEKDHLAAWADRDTRHLLRGSAPGAPS